MEPEDKLEYISETLRIFITETIDYLSNAKFELSTSEALDVMFGESLYRPIGELLLPEDWELLQGYMNRMKVAIEEPDLLDPNGGTKTTYLNIKDL